jgi:hypothetical protein
VKTLSSIEHVLRIYWSPERFDTDPRALEWGLASGLIAPSGSWWQVTDRGKVYVEALRNVPLPEQVTEWRMPA